MNRTINFQTISWFWDLYNRGLLDLDPPYQRRSVWNQDYKDYFIDTVLNGLPAPAIFIYQEITPEGVSKVSIVDGLSIYKITFEIQIKTAFEHAWSVSTHDLVYKNSEIDWRRLRLAAQIKATVEQLDTLILAFQETSGFIEDNDYSEIKIKRQFATEINKLFPNNIPDELRPKDMSRFCDNLYRLIDNAGKEKNIKQIIKQIGTKIQSTPTNQIPRSISLFQYFVAILIDKKIIEPPIENYHWHITEELKTLYPTIETNIDSIFLYSDDTLV